MALFTDGPPSSIEDLAAQDSQLLTVANVEGIDVTQKLGLAHDELGMELCAALSSTSRVSEISWVASKPNLAMVVVTPLLKLWHTYRALEMTYADAFNSQLNDRYAGKRDQFHTLAAWAHEKLVQNGLGINCLPVAQAANPTLLAAAGNLPDSTYYVSMTWVNRNGEEGAAATASSFTTTSSALLVKASDAPANATGWNVYVGNAPEGMALQNGAALQLGVNWLQANPPNTTGRGPGDGQKPSYTLPVPRILQRG
jgi:hypothetical protein